jgi:hypothetical protein
MNIFVQIVHVIQEVIDSIVFDSNVYGTHAPGITSHLKYPGAFLNECSVWSFWGCLFVMRFRFRFL